MDRDRTDIGPGINPTVGSTVNITTIGEEEIIIAITMIEITDPIIETTVDLEIETIMEMAIEGTIDMTVVLTIEWIILDKTMVTKGIEIEV